MENEKSSENIGHLHAQISTNEPARFTITPVGATEISGGQAKDEYLEERYEDIIEGEGRLPKPYTDNPTPFNDRVPLPYELQGYVHVSPRDDQGWRNDKSWGWSGGDEVIAEQVQAPPQGEYVSDDAFEKIVEGFKSGDGKFLAMTAYGAVPLPDQMLQTIPEKFVTKPLIQEREVFVLKQDHRVRVTERDYTQYDHRFVTVPKSIVVDKIKTIDDVKVIEVPHFRYQPVVEDKIVEIPYGIKYVEVPIEVTCKMPPRIIPVPKPHIVERIIEITKPVVQEKIIEIPEVTKKKVPRVVVKEIPYVVPKYVEKIVEVPYKSGRELPTPQGSPMSLIPKPPSLPGTRQEETEAERGSGVNYAQLSELQASLRRAVGSQALEQLRRREPQAIEKLKKEQPQIYERLMKLGPQAQEQLGISKPGEHDKIFGYAPSPPQEPQGRVEGNTLVVDQGPVTGPQTFYLSQGIKHIKLPYEARIDVTVVQENEIPAGVPIAQHGVRYMAPGSKALAYNETSGARSNKKPDEPVYAGPMDPIIEHAAPGMRAIEFRTRREEPDILTQQGVLKYSKFECCLKNDAEKLLPILPHHALVPMEPEGTPDWKGLTYIHSQHAARLSPDLGQKEPILKYRC